MEDILVIGAGPAGLATAVWAQRLGLGVRVFEQGSTAGGQLNFIQNAIEDYPGVEYTGPQLRDEIVRRLTDNGIQISLNSPVTDFDPVGRKLVVDGEHVTGRNIVIATGGRPRKLGIPGEDEMYQRGEVYRGSIHSKLMRDKSIVVVGGGDRAVENAYLFSRDGARVKLVHRGDKLTARKGIIDLLQTVPACEYYFNATPLQIVGREKVEGLELLQHNKKLSVAADAVTVCIGLDTNSSFIPQNIPRNDKGRIVTNHVFETAYPGVFAIGDVMLSSKFSSISTCVGQGMIVAKQIALAT